MADDTIHDATQDSGSRPAPNREPNRDDSVQRRFGAVADKYVGSAVHNSGYSLTKLLELVVPGPGKRALDLATGGGHVAFEMAKAGAWVVASDVTFPMLNAARQHLWSQQVSASYCGNDAQALPFANASFDIVTTRLAPHHFADIPRYVRECARVLRPGGVFGLVDHAGPIEMHVAKYVNAYEKLRDPSHVWELNQIEWEALLHESGLRVTHVELWPQRLNFVWWTQMQNNDAETVLRLRVLLRQMPPDVAAWMQPATPDDGEWAFTRWQIIMAGVKSAGAQSV
jgi:ubiquinone/menaquinone biosynthesis C-methylase UbiE